MQSKSTFEVNALVVTIAQEGSFVRAAKKLGITPPSLTRRIASLEIDIGAKLFDRTSRRVSLTKAGRYFVQESTVSLAHAERAWGLARHQGQVEHGPRQIGYWPCTPNAFLSLLSSLSLEPRPSGEGLSGVALATGGPMELVARVLRGDLDVGLSLGPVDDEDLWAQPVGREGMTVCIPRNHKLAAKAAVTVQDLDGETVFWMPPSIHPRFVARTTKYIRSLGAKPFFKEVQSLAHKVEFAAQGAGVALMNRSAARLSRTGVVFKDLSDRFLGYESVLFMRYDQRTGHLKELADDLFARLLSLRVEIH
jgi:DNA-binding transcriptional LysR family regulator